MGCFQSTLEGQASINEFLRKADTGDIVLFNNPMAITYITKCCTRSQWDHVGMVLRYSDNPAELILIESAGCGVFICYAEQRIKQCIEHPDPTTIGWRQLTGSGDRKAFKKGVHAYAESLIDTPYEQCFSDFVKAIFQQDDLEWPTKLAGLIGITAPAKGEDLNSLFCSELVAAIYKHASVVGQERDSNAYLPKDFSHASNARMKTQRPWDLTTERRVVTEKMHKEMQGHDHTDIKISSAERQGAGSGAISSGQGTLAGLMERNHGKPTAAGEELDMEKIRQEREAKCMAMLDKAKQSTEERQKIYAEGSSHQQTGGWGSGLKAEVRI